LNNYKIEISYDGSLFHGFQKQLNVRTVQSEIEDSLKLITQNYELNYAGRTDAGVHARSQIISLKTIDNLEPSFFNSLDSLLGDEIKIKKFQKVKNSFHPRFNAKSRVYKYFLQPNDKGTPYNRNYRYLVKTPLELDKLKSIEKIFLDMCMDQVMFIMVLMMMVIGIKINMIAMTIIGQIGGKQMSMNLMRLEFQDPIFLYFH